MCTVLLPPADNPIAVNKYIISYNANIELSYIKFGLRAPGNPVTAYLLGDAVKKEILCIHLSVQYSVLRVGLL